ncbi:isoprenoid biosynthesis glyoxalase ElbB [bacterium]|nr:isoprenoid biosynthesis glyoxalase ElbB [bacterium]
MSEKKYAVILSGSGYLDGSEIRESVLTFLALDTQKIAYDIFAPNIDQHHTLNHLTSNESDQTRNVLEESARIARSNISDLVKIDTSTYDGLVIPGGFGVAKNLCSFAFDGLEAKVNETVNRVVLDFHASSKPITAICIAPALVALCIKGAKLTLGAKSDASAAIESFGSEHVEASSSEFVVDEKNKIVSTPAYMHEDASLDEIYKGISGAIEAQTRL